MPNLNIPVSVRSIAFIDTQVENYQSLMAGVKPGTEVVVLEGNRDAIDQITQILALRSTIDSIHIVSHGAPGSLQLGEGSLSLDDIECDRDDLQQWFSPQTDSRSKNRPNILLYGCSVAAGETGKAFVKRLSELTGASVAASKNLTGSVAKGGDWELEVRTGKIEMPLVFEAEVLAGYEYVLNSFGAATNFGAASSPGGVNVGDFNADTLPDLVVSQNDGISILLGNGTGGFGTATNFAVGSWPSRFISGLFNNDNFPDLVGVNSNSNTISILLGNGPGGFGASSNFIVGNTPLSIGVGNFNADNFLDLAVVNADPVNSFGSVSILLGTGTGSFGTATNFNVGNVPGDVVVGDFNADSFSDLAVSNSGNGGSVSILLGNGTGGFGAATDYFGAGPTPQSIATGDFNGDNFLDLATANGGSNSVSILLGNGTGGFGPATTVNAGAGLNGIVVNDFSGDGILDLAVTGTSGAAILVGNGNGGFSAPISLPAGTSPTSIIVGNFNADTLPDLAVTNSGSDNVSVLLNTPNTVSFVPPQIGNTYNVTEGTTDTIIDVPVTISGGTPLSDVTVPIVIDPTSTATQDADYTLSTTSLTFSAGTTTLTQNIAVTIKADNIVDSNEQLVLNLGAITGGVAGGTSQVTLAILDRNSSYSIVADNPTVTEGNSGATPATFTITRSGSTELGSTVDYAITGTATNGTDYNNIGGTSGATAATGKISFAAGETSKIITLDVLGDGNIEPDETVAVTLSNSVSPGGAPTIATATATTTITNDDTAGITVSPKGISTTEAGGKAEFTVKLNAAPTADVTIGLRSDNLAEGTVSTNSLTFTPVNYNEPQTITVTGVDDLVADGPQAYKIVTAAAVSTDSNYNNVAPDDVEVTNSDDETPGITVNPTAGLTTGEDGTKANFTVVLNTQPTAEVTIGLTSDNVAEGTVSTNSLTFTPANWNTPQSVTVTGVNDSIADGDTAYKIVTATTVSTDPNYSNKDVTDVSFSNKDDDTASISITPTSTTATEGGANGSYALKLTSEPIAPVTINFNAPSEINAIAPVIFDSTNWNIAKTVTVTATDDSKAEGTHSGTIAHTVTSTDTKYSGQTIQDVNVAITDNDPVGVSISPTQTTATEGGADGSYTVKLNSQPIAPVTINFNAGSEINAIAPVIFDSTNWNVAQTVTVTATDDSKAEGTHSGTIAHTSASTDTKYNNLTLSPVTATIADNDPAGVTISPTSTTATEGGANGSYSVQLTSVPSAPVTISFGNGNQINAIADVTFDSTNWNVAKPVTVTAKDDAVVEGNHTGSISHTAQSADSKYSAIAIPGVTVAIADNNLAPEPGGGGTVEEPGGGGTVEEPGGGGTVEEPGGGGTVEEPGGGGTVEEPGGGGTVEEPGGGGT
ncbi:DUF4347 domain-containing protein, partial [Microcoleus sp. B3-A4]|uniref:DUF4347 domain-containing protein n=1 Tax=Microcoleus sp. B3-A4 TaxID=2818653 RepID=UPI002FD1CF99